LNQSIEVKNIWHWCICNNPVNGRVDDWLIKIQLHSYGCNKSLSADQDLSPTKYIFLFNILGYDKNKLANDIALLHVDKEFVIGNNIVPICLPKDSHILNKISKKNCSAAGWGKDPNGNKIIYWL
jgi:hypothetical protein